MPLPVYPALQVTATISLVTPVIEPTALSEFATSVARQLNLKSVRLVKVEKPEKSPDTDVNSNRNDVRLVRAENPETSPVTDVDCKLKYVKLVRTL